MRLIIHPGQAVTPILVLADLIPYVLFAAIFLLSRNDKH
jgi:hypothetical protein